MINCPPVCVGHAGHFCRHSGPRGPAGPTAHHPPSAPLHRGGEGPRPRPRITPHPHACVSCGARLRHPTTSSLRRSLSYPGYASCELGKQPLSGLAMWNKRSSFSSTASPSSRTGTGGRWPGTQVGGRSGFMTMPSHTPYLGTPISLRAGKERWSGHWSGHWLVCPRGPAGTGLPGTISAEAGPGQHGATSPTSPSSNGGVAAPIRPRPFAMRRPSPARRSLPPCSFLGPSPGMWYGQHPCLAWRLSWEMIGFRVRSICQNHRVGPDPTPGHAPTKTGASAKF